MKTDDLYSEEIAFLQDDKGNICVSVFVPTHPQSTERRMDRLKLEKALGRAKEYLHYKYRKTEAKVLADSLDSLYEELDTDHGAEGVGLFVSPHIKKAVHFFFPVTERVVVDRAFAAKDILYQHYYSIPYYLLLLTAHEARLYKGKINNLEEITDIHFPLEQVEEYEYNKPSRGSSYLGNAFTKEFEKDKSQLKDLRLRDFMRKTDEELKNFITFDTPLIVTGTEKDIALFKSASSHTPDMEICGNYENTPAIELGILSWKALKLVLTRRKEEIVTEFRETGIQSSITGIYEIWKAAKEGRGLKLLIEKDFALPGFLRKGDDYNLFLHVPTEPHDILPDVIEALIRIVIEKHGQVVLLDNGMLSDFQRIAMITRY